MRVSGCPRGAPPVARTRQQKSESAPRGRTRTPKRRPGRSEPGAPTWPGGPCRAASRPGAPQ
eukprot:6377086-Alexandrium_andersonii.AAC.1